MILPVSYTINLEFDKTKVWSILSKREQIGALILSVTLLFAMFLEVLGLGILLPLISVIIDPERGGEFEFINEIKIFFNNISDRDFVIYFLVFFLIETKTIFFFELSSKTNKFLLKSLVFNRSLM